MQPWINARAPGGEVQRTDELYTVGQYETGYILPRGLALQEGPSTAIIKLASTNVALTEITTGAPASNQYRVLYDPVQALGGSVLFNAAQAGLVMKYSYKDRGQLLWAHDLDRMENAASGGPLGAREVFNIGGIQAWYESKEIYTLPGAGASVIDWSGNSRNLDNVGGGAPNPLFQPGLAGIGGASAFRFGAASNLGGRIGTAVAGSPSTVIALYAPLTTTNTDYRLVIGQANVLIGPYVGLYNFHNSGFINGPAVVAGQFKTAMMTIDPTAGTKAYLDNALVGSNATTTGWGSGLYLGYNTSGAGALNINANSDLALLLVFNKVLSALESNIVHAYIRGRYGLAFTMRTT